MFKPSSQNGLHSKIYMIDRQVLVVGSFNFDPRSVQINTEQVLVIHSPRLCAKIARLFEDVTSPTSSYRVMLSTAVPPTDQPAIQAGDLAWMTRENGKTVYYDFNPHAGFWRNVMDSFFSILPIDTEL
jgi:putative cardiolipin synthase